MKVYVLLRVISHSSHHPMDESEGDEHRFTKQMEVQCSPFVGMRIHVPLEGSEDIETVWCGSAVVDAVGLEKDGQVSVLASIRHDLVVGDFRSMIEWGWESEIYTDDRVREIMAEEIG